MWGKKIANSWEDITKMEVSTNDIEKVISLQKAFAEKEAKGIREYMDAQEYLIERKDKQIQSLERIIKELKEHEDIYVQQMHKLETDIKALKEDSLKER